MTYCLLKKADDEDIPLILSVYKQNNLKGEENQCK